ncbi:hypothetical protein LOC67_08675 [Stieleria sp. JC731]|uniref:hypothetical protein n=1 Tax=Pirellulaceae TaxID=2691357 RepID=UPI001E457292|nr:hypothetical protein [Stieleria sp. JC731]MCC9600634.1 hypothetical protein [Stieleria sp. JC731]
MSGHPTQANDSRVRPARLLLGALVAFAPLSGLALSETAFAQQPQTQYHSSANQQSSTTEGWNLRWRKSSQVAPAPAHVPQSDVFAQPAATTSPRHVAALRANSGANSQAHAAVQTAHHQQGSNVFARQPNQQAIQQVAHTEAAPANSGLGQPQRGPVANYRRATPIAQNQLQERLPRPEDFFNDPFADGTNAGGQAVARVAAVPIPVPQTEDEPAAKGFGLPDTLADPNSAPSNDMRSNPFRNGAIPDPSMPNPAAEQLSPAAEQLGMPGQPSEQIPVPDPELPMPSQAAPSQPSQGRSSLRGLLNDPDLFPKQQADQAAEQPVEEIPAPSAQPADAMDDFRFTPPAPSNQSGRSESSPSDRPSDRFGDDAYSDTAMLRSNELSCEDFRERIARETIDKISLDPSPPFRPDLFDPEDYDRQREKFEQRQSVRAWSNLNGQEVARGKLIGLAYEQVIIENEAGQRQELSVHRISEGDLGYLADNWGLPKECLVEQVAYTPRTWSPMTMTWKASNLCSKPRYFEEVNLERYGHTAGPWLQPVVSSAHFFANIAVLPYKMGIHPPNECVYALGYYRPGNCAPWIVPPVPVSARGALAQGAFMSGAFWLVP